ncbi:site-2 protease family protein [Thioalkalivibrio denitrificans]|uniref:Zinc metalloprotease n=1 Tax=Thioalkalivibrio denitrificans TaxID=108003 RepID=A0A1V3NCF0_9GAMM|nr:site-2 protease family protein [Thioalkalivibrio denitrificans]OOG22777.1 site-2 protease family protein [Thioalkalivibrio denitrificans]
MFGESFRLFRILGFEIRANVTWLFLALLVTWSLAAGLFPFAFPDLSPRTYWLMAIVGMFGLFFSLLFHELSHSVVARAFGLPVGGITLFLFGGMAEIQAEAKRPREEFWMAIAGPIASVVLGAAFYLVSVLMLLLGVPDYIAGVPLYLGFLNILLAVFNMVPGFPMDGGRVLRAALWHLKGDLRWATLWASRFGQGFGLLLVALGIYSFLLGNFVGGMWWFLIGLFIRGAAIASYRQVDTQLALKGQTVRRFMTTDPVTVPAEATIREFVDDYLYHHAHDVFPVIRDGKLLGRISLRHAKTVPRADWDRTRVDDVCRQLPEEFTVDADSDAAQALDRMQQNQSGRLVVTENGRIVGILVLKDLLRYLQIRSELERA